MSLIDKSYFEKRLLAVPNLEKETIETNLTDYIDEFEDRYLDIMLGVKLKKEFLAGVDDDPIAQIWIDLRDGKEYEISGIVYRWQGFVNTKKLSPIANYVFANYITENQFLNTRVGEVLQNVENSRKIPAHVRVAQVWNEMVKLNKDLVHFLNEFERSYESWDFCYKTPLIKKDNVIGI